MKFLQGYKTYLTALAAITGAVASVATGAIGLGEAINLIVTAVLAVTVRHGVEGAKQIETKDEA